MGDTGVTGTVPLLLVLILTHLAGDFMLQTSKWIDEKQNAHLASKHLYLHAAIHGSLAFMALILFLPLSISVWTAAVAVTVTHFAIDLARSYTPRDKARWFIADQLLHISVIAAIWLSVTDQWSSLNQIVTLSRNTAVLIVATSYVVVIWPLSNLIGLICKRWADNIENLESLPKGGARIGQLERLLILTFVLADQFTAIGFLLAAKSVLRFGDMKEANHRNINEYILLGTMVSFSMTIVLGLAAKWLLSIL